MRISAKDNAETFLYYSKLLDSGSSMQHPSNFEREIMFHNDINLFELFLGTKLAGVSAFLLSAVGSTGWKTGVAFSADGLFAIETLSQQGQSGVIDSTTKTKHQMQGRLLLNVVITQSAAIFKLLARKDESLLIRRNALFVLDLGLDIVDRVTGLHVKRDGFARQGLDENLHGCVHTKAQGKRGKTDRSLCIH